jgi:hypothetical protein
MGREGDACVSAVEPLILLAVSNNQLHSKVYSPSRPKDEIWYDLDNDTTKYDWAVADGKGVIYRRIDQNNNDLPYDFKQIRFRRHKVNYNAIPVWNSTEIYEEGELVRNSGTPNNIIYIALKEVPANQNPTELLTKYWIPLLQDVGNIYWAVTASNGFWGMTFGPWGTSGVQAYLTDYQDLYTFGADVESSDETYVYNNIFEARMTSAKYTLPNTVFYDTCYNNRFRAPFYNNTIGGSFTYNEIGSMVRNNSICTGFTYNVIKASFISNLIGKNCAHNVFSGSASGNILSDNFKENRLGEHFDNNAVNVMFIGNTVDSYMAANVIGYNFSSNHIGSEFEENRIAEFFYGNVVGTGFYTNTILSGFRNNTIKSGMVEKDFTSYNELYGKAYGHTIEASAGNKVVFWWFDANSQMQITEVV